MFGYAKKEKGRKKSGRRFLLIVLHEFRRRGRKSG